jgi:uncharacterized membrane protein YkgB
MKNNFSKDWKRFDARLVGFMARFGIELLRGSLAIIFIWFGLLKVLGLSPVAGLVAHTVYWFPPEIFIPILGWWEIIVGFGLLLHFALRLTLFLFWLQLIGTFLVLVFLPHVAFQRANPFLLTLEGEFVIKNLILITAGIVIGGTIRPQEKRGK